jgi:hypothetical protein
MILWRLASLAVLFTAVGFAASDTATAALLAKALAAFEKNVENEKHWNWLILETRDLVDKSGALLQHFPNVTSESVIRSDERRCNAVTAWGDGRAPYLKNADPDQRCQAYDALSTPFRVTLLLQSSNARLVQQSASAITIAVFPDKSVPKSASYSERCAASIKATITLDPATYFPTRIEGAVTESGCDAEFRPVVHYETVTREPMISQFRKGVTFSVDYALQKDRFDNPANAYWISATQRYSQPWNSEARVLYYWGRQLPVNPTKGHLLVKEIKTTAQEFGAGSQLRFDK